MAHVIRRDRGVGEAQEVDDRLQVRDGRDNGADIEVPIGQAIDALTDAECDRIVHRGMTHRARQTDGTQAAIAIENANHAEHRVRFDQLHCHGGVVEVDLTLLEAVREGRRQRLGIDFQAQIKRLTGADRRHDLMQAELIAPEGLVAKGVEAEDLLALADELPGIFLSVAEKIARRFLFGRFLFGRFLFGRSQRHSRQTTHRAVTASSETEYRFMSYFLIRLVTPFHGRATGRNCSPPYP